MVEKKEFAIIFRNEKNINGIQEFIPMDVIEGTYDSLTECFISSKDSIEFIHIEDVPEHVVGFAYRTVLEYSKQSISEAYLEEFKIKLMENIRQYTFARNPKSGCVVAINIENGDEYLVENEEFQTSVSKSAKSIEIDMTPLELEEKIRNTIKGQDEAIRKIVTALWTTLKFRNMRKKNMLVIGPSGVGKTAIFEKIKKILNIPVIIFSVPGLSQSGYIGRSTDEILKQVYYETCEDLEMAESAIIILDEIDKLAYQGVESGAVSTSGVQNELLKIIEGCVRYIESSMPGEEGFELDTSRMIFIGTGAFQELHEQKKASIGFNGPSQNNQNEKKKINAEQLRQYGLKRELLGRLPIIVELNSLGKEELKDIILNSDESELTATINALQELGVEIQNIDEVIDYIVDDAIENKIGARGLILTINNLFQEIFYEVGNNPNKYSKVIIGSNIINDKKDYTLIKKRNYTRKKVKTN